MAGRHSGQGCPSIPRRRTTPALTELREHYVYAAKPLDVDEAAKIIRHVKVLGRTSPNNHGMRGAQSTLYTDAALSSLAGWINESGFKVNVNHIPKDQPDRNRKAEDRLGKLIPGTAVMEADGVYADMQYLAAHPMAALVVEAAQEMPDAFGMSINAFGRGLVQNGVYMINEIVKQPNSSVDVVANAGTVTSLSESRQDMAKPNQKPGKKTKLREDGMGTGSNFAVPDMEDGDTPATDVSPEDQLKAGFRAAIMSIVDDDSMSTADKCSKITNYIKTHEKLTSDTEDDDSDQDEPDETETEESRRDKKPSKGLTALREELDTLKRRETVRGECDDAKYQPTKELFEALCVLSDSKARKALIEQQKKLLPAPAPGTPRSIPSGRLQESHAGGTTTPRQPVPVTDGKSFASALKSR